MKPGRQKTAKGFYKVQAGEPQTETRYLDVGTGADIRHIAYRHTPGATSGATGLFWLPGYKSDMASTKATAVAAWAREHGLASTLFDYSGHGLSSGAFTDGTIGRWFEEAYAVFTKLTRGPQVIVGSSMGGHIALLLLCRLAEEADAENDRAKGAVLIAPAWDMTEELMWKRFPDDARRALIDDGVFLRPSPYGEPYAITRALIEDGRNHLLARRPFDPGCPIVILQGQLDPDVPVDHTRELLTFLKGQNVDLIEIPDGEHRLSRPEDLHKLFSAIARLS